MVEYGQANDREVLAMDVVSTLSSTGRKVNEDFIHLQPNRWAMLLDGSSGLMPNVLVPHLQGRFQSDAQWFVHTFAHAFAQVEQPSTPLPTAVEQALALVEQQYQAIPIADHLRGFAYEPSASLAIFRNTQESGPELFLLGDCTAIWDGGVYHDPAVSRLDDRAIQLCMHLSDTTGQPPAEVIQSPAMRAKLLEHREKKNHPEQPDGYTVLAPHTGLAQYGTHLSLSGQGVHHVFLMSDGLAAGYQSYHLEPGPQEYLHAACSQGLSSLLSRVRAVEQADQDLRQFPRLKPSDDASGVLVELAQP